MGQADASVGQLPPWTARRRPRRHLAKIVRRHAAATGSLLMAWNEAHGELFDVFRHLSAAGDFTTARNVWLVIQSDDQRRRAVEASAHAMKSKVRLKNAVLWATARLAEFSATRNFAAHVYYRDWGGAIEADYFSTTDAKLEKIEAAQWVDDAPAMAGDLYAIADYIRGIALALGSAKSAYPLTRKPKLRSRRMTEVSTSQAKQKRASRPRKPGGTPD